MLLLLAPTINGTGTVPGLGGAVSKEEFLPVFVDKVIRKGFEAMKMQPFEGYELRATKTHRRWRVNVKRVVTECARAHRYLLKLVTTQAQ